MVISGDCPDLRSIVWVTILPENCKRFYSISLLILCSVHCLQLQSIIIAITDLEALLI